MWLSGRGFCHPTFHLPIYASLTSLFHRKAHLLEHTAAEQAVVMRQGLENLEVIVALADQELERLAGGLQGGREVARLALELGRLASPVADHQRADDSIEMA